MKQLGLNLLKAAGLIVLLLAVNTTPLRLISYQKELGNTVSGILLIVYLVLVVTIIYYLWRYYKKLNPTKFSFGWGDVGYGLIWFVAARGIAIAGTLLIMVSSGQMTSANDAALGDFAEQLRGGFLPFAILYLGLITFIAPILEELIFRGFLIEFFFKNRPKWQGWVVTSLIFALIHAVAPIEILMYFGLGSIFYLAYDRRGDIRDSILAHFLNNLLPAIVLAITIFS